MKVLISGANGFIGQELSQKLLESNWQIRGSVRARRREANLHECVEIAVVEGIGPKTDWSSALEGVKVVVHLAARVHVMNDVGIDPLPEYRKVNVAGSENLARQAAAVGVKRFIFLSSVKVNGEGSAVPYTENDDPSPEDPYAISKLEAEEAICKVAGETGLEVVIIRPPLVYGPGVKANFLRLIETVDRGIPLPLGGIRNRRSFVCLGNLVDAIVLCMNHPDAAGQTYLVSDGEDISTPELIKRLAAAMGKKARLFSFPLSLLRLVGKVAGKFAMVERLVGSLQVDSSKIRRELGWRPPFTMEQGLRETAEWYMRQARGDGQ